MKTQETLTFYCGLTVDNCSSNIYSFDVVTAPSLLSKCPRLHYNFVTSAS